MNPDASLNPQQKLEMRVTALLLGELPQDQADTLRAQIAADPALADLHNRLQQAIMLLREARKIQPATAEETPARLSTERRERLFAHFKPAPTAVAPPRRDWSWIASLGIAATFVVLVGGALMSVRFSETYMEPPDFVAPGNRDMAIYEPTPAEDVPPAADMPAKVFSGDVVFSPAPPPGPDIEAITTTTAKAMPAAPQPFATPAPAMSAKGASRWDASRIAGSADGWAGGGTVPAPAPLQKRNTARVDEAQAELDLSATLNSGPLSASTGISVTTPAQGTGRLSLRSESGADTSTFSGAISGAGAIDSDFFSQKSPSLPAISLDSPTPVTTSLGIVFSDSSSLTKSGAGTLVLTGKDLDADAPKPGDITIAGRMFSNEGGGEATKDVAPLNGGTLSMGRAAAAPTPPEMFIRGQAGLAPTPAATTATPAEPEITAETRSTKTEIEKAKKAHSEQAYNEARSRQLWQANTAWRSRVQKPEAAAEIPGNAYQRYPGMETPKLVFARPLTPQPEIATSENAFSTFSLNVTDVAFKLAAASLDHGQMPDPGSMRSEEFINAFNYRDPEPVADAPLAFVSERARYPFAQNRDVLRLSVKTASAGRAPGRALNLVLLLDSSGSMERADRVRIVQEALRVLAAQLQAADKLSVITFARTPRLWIDGVSGDKAATSIARVTEMTPEGGTNLEAALDLGYKTAHRYFQPGSINRVVLLTDGAANLGDVDPEALKQKVEVERKQGIALDAFGVGWDGLDDTMLETLSRNGDGRYGFINTPEAATTEFAGQLAGALRVAASDVKVQVEFNPRRVGAYRQIGYAKHQLTKEQFRDNTVDAAEIGAAESGNALYTIEVNPRGEGDIATVRVRFKIPGTSDYREHSWSVPFTPNVPPLDQASPSLRLAGAAAAFSEMLAGSQFATEVTSDALLRIIHGVPATYASDPRPAKLAAMIQQARSISGR